MIVQYELLRYSMKFNRFRKLIWLLVMLCYSWVVFRGVFIFFFPFKIEKFPIINDFDLLMQPYIFGKSVHSQVVWAPY